MMHRAMAECYRVLKPGRWLSLCYHDTSEGTWALIQDIMAEVGFIVGKGDSALFIDTGQKSYNQLTADKVTKRDLVINFRKPRPGEAVESLFISGDEETTTFNEKIHAVIREFLDNLPMRDGTYHPVIHAITGSGFGLFKIKKTTPADKEEDVPGGTEISIEFNSQPKLSTIRPDGEPPSVTVTEGENDIAYEIISTANRILIVKPCTPLTPGKEYTVSLSTTLHNIYDMPLAEDYSFSFTVYYDGMDVLSTDPTDGEVDVDYTTKEIVISFSKYVDIETINAGSITISPEIAYRASASGTNLTLSLPDGLDTDTEYKITLTKDVASTHGEPLEDDYVFFFTTRKQEFPPDDEDEEWQYEIGELIIESPDKTCTEVAQVMLRTPDIRSTSGKHPPKWRLHYKILTYGDPEHMTLIESVSSENNPELFLYSPNHGVTWEAFPSDGLPPQHYGSLIQVCIRCGRNTAAYLVPSFGAEPV